MPIHGLGFNDITNILPSGSVYFVEHSLPFDLFPQRQPRSQRTIIEASFLFYGFRAGNKSIFLCGLGCLCGKSPSAKTAAIFCRTSKRNVKKGIAIARPGLNFYI
jgi:hypothetical protein